MGLEIFRVGKHTTLDGRSFDFSEAELQAAVTAYDPAKSQAPLVVGHPQLNSPAYGWVKSLAMRPDGVLEASPDQVDPAFGELVNAGRFNRLSASFYLPDSPGNPSPGSLYLRHVGFLGAQPPAVKGLKPASFADGSPATVSFGESDEGVVAFGEGEDLQQARLWRGLREWLISQHGAETADRVVPSWTVESLEQAALQALQQEQAEPASYAEPPAPVPAPVAPPAPPVVDPAAEQIAQQVAQQAAQLKQQAEELKQREARLAVRERLAELTNFAEGLEQAGRLLPVDRRDLVEFMAELGTAPVQFGEGEPGPSRLAWFQAWLSRLPKQVEFAELAAPEAPAAGPGTIDFAQAPYSTLDPERLELHRQAKAFAAQHQVDFVTAVLAVQQGGAK